MPSIITQETETQEQFDGNGYSIGLFEATAGSIPDFLVLVLQTE